MNRIISSSIGITALIAWAAAATAEETKPEYKFELHGFVGGSLYVQDAQTNSAGSAANYVTGTPNLDRAVFSADVRQTRLNFSLAGPQVFGGAVPKAVVELDFYGGPQPAGGATEITAASPRLRLAFGELNWGSTLLRFGQDSDLVMGSTFPATIGHAGVPLTYHAGSLGNRHAGIFFFQNAPVGETTKVELALQVTRSFYDDRTIDPMSSPASGSVNLGLADSSGLPAVEARAKLKGKEFELWIAGHWNRVDLNGVDDKVPTDPHGATREVVAGNLGGWVKLAGFELRGSAFAGKNLAALGSCFGQLAPIASTSTTKAGDIHELGGWAQLGYDFPVVPGLSAWVLAGIDRPKQSEVKDAVGGSGKWSNLVTSALLRYSDGGYQVGLEYARWFTRYIAPPASSPAPSATTGAISPYNSANKTADLKGDQLMLSGVYFF